MTDFTYDAVLVTEGDGATPLVLFAAPATAIERWVGVPQRLMLGADETVGFQRTVSDTRLEALVEFFTDARNIVQNPILGAVRNAPGVEVSFVPSTQGSSVGKVVIKTSEEELKWLRELFREVRETLEARDPELKTREFPLDLYKAVEARARSEDMTLEAEWEISPKAASPDEEKDESVFEDAGDGSDEGVAPTLDASAGADLAAAVEDALEESHMTEFWDQLRAREQLSENLGASCPTDQLFGFSREVLLSYLRPVVLVDGQHRLAGAVEAARRRVASDPQLNAKMKALIGEGKSADETQAVLEEEAARILPMSLSLNTSSAEHVFQFVVVNQRATPVAKALLGTIVSTSLASGELDSIRDRLVRARIEVEGSQVIAGLARNPSSPFAGRIARGFETDTASKLPWSVVGGLAEMFRTLRGGVFYHLPKIDYAALWAKLFLPQSSAVDDWAARGYSSPLAYWREPDGPWQPLFIAFWTAVRARLASEDDSAPNAWANPRKSNLFNKPSLTILQVDFFAYLTNVRATLTNSQDVEEQVTR